MSQQNSLLLPISFDYLKIPVRWTLERPGRLIARSAQPCGREMRADHGAFHCREEFFRLAESDAALLQFLATYGLWDATVHIDPEGVRHGMVEVVETAGVWQFRQKLRTALLKRIEVEGEMFHLPPRRIALGDVDFDFVHGDAVPMAFDLRGKAPVARVRLVAVRELLLATVYVDLLRGQQFKQCARKDCRLPFPLLNRHRRLYCSAACAHLVAVRRSREQ